jgi:hypothetical protein
VVAPKPIYGKCYKILSSQQAENNLNLQKVQWDLGGMAELVAHVLSVPRVCGSNLDVSNNLKSTLLNGSEVQ